MFLRKLLPGFSSLTATRYWYARSLVGTQVIIFIDKDENDSNNILSKKKIRKKFG